MIIRELFIQSIMRSVNMDLFTFWIRLVVLTGRYMSNSSILITKLGGKNMNIKKTRTVKAIKAQGAGIYF